MRSGVIAVGSLARTTGLGADAFVAEVDYEHIGRHTPAGDAM